MKLVLCIALGMLLTLTACEKEDEASNCEKLEGKWTLSSWLEDGEEFFGDTIYITSSIIEFKTLENMQGDMNWTISYLLGGDLDIIGSYAVNASCDTVTITPKSGVPIPYAFDIEGDILTLDRQDFAHHIEQEYTRQ